jgi:methionyl-tRNA formyltransferase
MEMKLVFCGTPEFAVLSLEKLAAHNFDIQLVVTQPDRPQGRGMVMTAPPVKQAAIRLGLPVVQPDKIKKNEEFQQQLRTIAPDAIMVVGYGRIIPPWMLELPPLGNINVHASLLPKYRGAAPIQWAIARGETTTGVTTMRIDEGLDTGDMLLKREMKILPDDTTETLSPRLAELGAGLLVETLLGLQQGKISAIPQNHAEATLAPILKKEDGLIDFQRISSEINDRLRGFQPWPGIYTRYKDKNLKVVSAQPVQAPTVEVAQGTMRITDSRLFVGCGAGTLLELIQVQPEGKKVLSAREFINGYRPADGERLG